MVFQTTIMNSTSDSVKTNNGLLNCCSYNMYGFWNGLSMLQTLCSTHDVILLQEHWLHSYEIQKLSDMFSEFNVFGISAMNDKVSLGLFCGRPFGGVALMWRKSCNFVMKVLDADEGGRYLAASLMFDNKLFIIHCVYFPCNSSSIEYIVEMTNLVSKLELILENFPCAYHIIAGDFNFSSKSGGHGFELFKSMAGRCNIVDCDNFNTSDIDYTYRHDSLDHQ